MDHVWKPAKDSGFKGEVKIEVPKYRARLKMIKECNFKIGVDGQVSVNEDSLDSIVKLIEVAEPFVKKVDLKLKEKHFGSFEELEENPVCDGILNEICGLVMSGPQMGNV